MFAKHDGGLRGRRKLRWTWLLKLVNSFTRNQLDEKNCVDYMVDNFVKDKFLTVKQVIKKHILDEEHRAKMKDLTPFVEESLKCFYGIHVGKDNDQLHDVYSTEKLGRLERQAAENS